MSDTAPVEYVELNMLNYNEDDVSQLNEWGAWAYDEIERLKEFLPTAEHINALPDRLRSYLHDLETKCDPAGELRARVLAEDMMGQLEAMVKWHQEEFRLIGLCKTIQGAQNIAAIALSVPPPLGV